jgi:hypothetical protein
VRPRFGDEELLKFSSLDNSLGDNIIAVPPPPLPSLYNVSPNSSFTSAATSAVFIERAVQSACAALRVEGIDVNIDVGVPSVSSFPSKSSTKETGSKSKSKRRFWWTICGQRVSDGADATLWITVFSTGEVSK